MANEAMEQFEDWVDDQDVEEKRAARAMKARNAGKEPSEKDEYYLRRKLDRESNENYNQKAFDELFGDLNA